jgi:ribosomal-protein-alanine N-acetyltransferase
MPQVLAIERRSYNAPWSLAMFVLETAKSGGLCVVARAFSSGAPASAAVSLVGYAIVSKYDDAFHVMNVCVDPNRRREGIARGLLEHVIARAGADEARLTLEVRPSNTGARALYDDLGVLSVGVRRRYYRDDGEDALIMWRTPATLQGRTYDIPGADDEGAGPGSRGPVPPDVPNVPDVAGRTPRPGPT